MNKSHLGKRITYQELITPIKPDTHHSNDYYVHYIYDSPHYVRVNRKVISDINISLFLDTGELVRKI